MYFKFTRHARRANCPGIRVTCAHRGEGAARRRATTERALQDFANGKLAAFKVPKKIVILEEIPKGATGKLQRIGLAQKLGLT